MSPRAALWPPAPVRRSWVMVTRLSRWSIVVGACAARTAPIPRACYRRLHYRLAGLAPTSLLPASAFDRAPAPSSIGRSSIAAATTAQTTPTRRRAKPTRTPPRAAPRGGRRNGSSRRRVSPSACPASSARPRRRLGGCVPRQCRIAVGRGDPPSSRRSQASRRSRRRRATPPSRCPTCAAGRGSRPALPAFGTTSRASAPCASCTTTTPRTPCARRPPPSETRPTGRRWRSSGSTSSGKRRSSGCFRSEASTP
mmetsp:Transcript_13001/g.37427  ORF Transcript_13001/g.37427 Transcript_13001/m.37427 type:complete len:254 (-) Transcript_13001:110-871(-)